MGYIHIGKREDGNEQCELVLLEYLHSQMLFSRLTLGEKGDLGHWSVTFDGLYNGTAKQTGV